MPLKCLLYPAGYKVYSTFALGFAVYLVESLLHTATKIPVDASAKIQMGPNSIPRTQQSKPL